MGHRRNRANATRPRRIHATEEEWRVVRERADKAGLSISAYLVDVALARPELTSCRVEADAIRLLTVSHQALSEISDSIAAGEPGLDDLPIAEALDRVADLLDGIVETVMPGGAGRRGGR